MTAQLLDGKALAKTIQKETREQIKKLGIRPSLAVLLAGNDPASELYVSLKQRSAEQVGIMVSVYRFDADVAQQTVLQTIDWLNADAEIDAILVQLPLPEHLDEHVIIAAVAPEKDVDGFHPENIKKLLAGESERVPGLHMGILQLLAASGETLQGKRAVIAAKSQEFTETLSYVLQSFGITTVVVAPTPEARSALSEADIIITAAGKPGFITQAECKAGAIIIDVGTTKLSDGTIAGDVNRESCSTKAAWISPVPGGVGPMTVAMLLKNTVMLAISQAKKS